MTDAIPALIPDVCTHPLDATLDQLSVATGLLQVPLQPGLHRGMIFGFRYVLLQDLGDSELHGMGIVQPGNHEFLVGHLRTPLTVHSRLPAAQHALQGSCHYLQKRIGIGVATCSRELGA